MDKQNMKENLSADGPSYEVDASTLFAMSPKASDVYFDNVAKTAYREIRKKGNSDVSCSILVDESYRGCLENSVNTLSVDSREELRMSKEMPNFQKCFIGGILGLGAAVATYSTGAHIATDLAEGMNNYSTLLAPVAGLVQVGMSLGFPAVAGLFGYAGGSEVGAKIQKIQDGRLEKKVGIFDKIREGITYK